MDAGSFFTTTATTNVSPADWLKKSIAANTRLIARAKRSAKSNRDAARQVASIEQALGLNPESRA
jgi:hypothetical protein